MTRHHNATLAWLVSCSSFGKIGTPLIGRRQCPCKARWVEVCHGSSNVCMSAPGLRGRVIDAAREILSVKARRKRKRKPEWRCVKRQRVFTLTTSAFLTSTETFLDEVKECSGPFFDAQQLGVRLNFDVDVKSAVFDVFGICVKAGASIEVLDST